MKKVILRVAIFAWGACFSERVSAQDMPHLDSNDLPQAKIASHKLYQGEGLYGYIDGGAELYIAYGFDRLLLQEVELAGEKYTIQVYSMADPQSAFGIYSLYQYKCDSSARLTRSECSTAYQYLAERNKFYYSVINQSGSKLARQLGLDLARIMAGKIHPDSIPWPDLFNMDVFIGYQNTLKYIRGNIALQQVLVDWNRYFESIKFFSLWYLPVENEMTGNLYIAFINFLNAADRNTFIRNTSLRLCKPGDRNLMKGKLGWLIGEHNFMFMDNTDIKEPSDPYASAIYQFMITLNKKK